MQQEINTIQVVDAKVRWFDGASNDPELLVALNRPPAYNEMVYEEYMLGTANRHELTLYVAEHQGIVNYLLEDPRNREGFGGREFEIQVPKKGSETKTKILKGPWSSRAGVVNRYTSYDIVDVVYTGSDLKPGAGARIALTREKAEVAAQKASHHEPKDTTIVLEPEHDDHPSLEGEYTYVPRKRLAKRGARHLLPGSEYGLLMSYLTIRDLMEHGDLTKHLTPELQRQKQAAYAYIDRYFTKYYGRDWMWHFDIT